MIEPPPKPARQPQIQPAKATDSWEDALENWSGRRKERQKATTTWYATESYPTGKL